MKKINIRKLAEKIAKAVNDGDSELDGIEAVEDILNLYTIDWKMGPKHELSTKNVAWQLRWDYKAWEKVKPEGVEMYQHEWNQTILTNINRISAEMHKATLRGGVNIIKAHPFLEDFFRTIPYYDGITIGGRYEVIFDDSIKVDEIFMMNKEWNNVLFVPEKLVDKDGNPLNEVTLRHLSYFTDEEVSDYNKKLIGRIKIDSLPKLEEHVRVTK